MRLAFVSTGDPVLDTFDEAITSGGSGPIWKLASSAVERGHEVTVFAGTHESDAVKTIDGVDIVEVSTPRVGEPIDRLLGRLPILRAIGRGDELSTSPGHVIERVGPRLVFSWRVARILEEQSVDVVYLRDRVSGTFPVRLDVPSVFTVVAPDACDFFYEASVDRHPANRVLFRYKQRLEEHCLRHADQTIAMSDGMAGYLREKGFENVSVVTVGIDESEFSRAGLVDPEPIVLYVGRLDGNKRPEWVLEAFERVAPSDFELHIIGDGPRCSHLEDVLRTSDRQQDITLHGAIPRAEVLAWMRRGSVFVLPSRFETCGNVIVEAMGSGCAVVASDTFGGRQLVEDGETGLLFDRDDPAALASALAALLGDNERREHLARNAYRHAREAHSTAAITDSYIAEGRRAIEAAQSATAEQGHPE